MKALIAYIAGAEAGDGEGDHIANASAVSIYPMQPSALGLTLSINNMLRTYRAERIPHCGVYTSMR